jgi:hypothetical protein
LNERVVRTEDLKKFVVEREIGVGGQAHVYRVRKATTKQKDESQYAIKVMAKAAILDKTPYE